MEDNRVDLLLISDMRKEELTRYVTLSVSDTKYHSCIAVRPELAPFCSVISLPEALNRKGETFTSAIQVNDAIITHSNDLACSDEAVRIEYWKSMGGVIEEWGLQKKAVLVCGAMYPTNALLHLQHRSAAQHFQNPWIGMMTYNDGPITVPYLKLSLDMALGNATFTAKFQKWFVMQDCGSDHLPVMLTFSLEVPHIKSKRLVVRSFLNVDDSLKKLKVRVQNGGSEGIDSLSKFSDVVLESLCFRKVDKDLKPWWDTELKQVCNMRSSCRKFVMGIYRARDGGSMRVDCSQTNKPFKKMARSKNRSYYNDLLMNAIEHQSPSQCQRLLFELMKNNFKFKVCQLVRKRNQECVNDMACQVQIMHMTATVCPEKEAVLAQSCTEVLKVSMDDLKRAVFHSSNPIIRFTVVPKHKSYCFSLCLIQHSSASYYSLYSRCSRRKRSQCISNRRRCSSPRNRMGRSQSL